MPGISGDRVDLSLRRVTQKEQKEVKEKYKQERSYEKILKSVLGEEKGKKIIQEISKKNRIYDFLQNAKEKPKEFEKLIGKENLKKILDIIKTQKQKKAVLKKEIFMTTKEPNGIELIKNFLKMIKETEVKYISSGKYSLKKKSEDIKKADQELTQTLAEIEKKARKKGVEFNIIKK